MERSLKTAYFGDWKDSGYFGMVSDFAGLIIDKDTFDGKTHWPNGKYEDEQRRKMAAFLSVFECKDEDVIFACYTYENYSGDALVVYKKNGKLYEVNGSHCSCYGLGEETYGGDRGKSQWDPEETSKEALLKRADASSYGVVADFKEDFLAALEAA